jgi:hypothetical protein
VQWEFAGRLGPPAGRYVVRRFAGDDVRQVIVVSEHPSAVPVEATRRWAPRRRAALAPPPEVAPVTRVTVIDAEPLAGVEEARAWLVDAGVAEDAAGALARVVSAYRISAADPAIADPDPAAALCTRVGYGSGTEVAEGAWEAARELRPAEPPRGRRRRAAGLNPYERVAALLAGRDAALASEELALRARGDLAHGRDREAALQLEAALLAARSELEGWREHADLARRLDELAGYSEGVAAAAAAAREGRLDGAHVEHVSAALARLEAALRARAVYANRG